MVGLFAMLTLLSLFCLIIGLMKPNFVILWGDQEQKNRKNVLKYYGLGMLIFSIFFSITSPDVDEESVSNVENNEEIDENKEVYEAETDEVEIDTEIEVSKEENESTPDLEIMDANYLLMWNNYTDEYKGEYLRLAGRIDYVGDSHINIKEGLEGLTGNIHLSFEDDNLDQLESLSEGDHIIVTGKNSGKLGGQISIKDSNIEVIGEEALKKVNENKELADKVFEEERLEAEKLEKEEKNKYISDVTIVNYEDLLRNPHEYKDKKIKVTIKITQLMAGGLLTDSGYAGKEGNDEWYISYKLPEHSIRILEGDYITFYGEFDDVVEMKRSLTRTKVYIPRLKAKYFDFQN